LSVSHWKKQIHNLKYGRGKRRPLADSSGNPFGKEKRKGRKIAADSAVTQSGKRHPKKNNPANLQPGRQVKYIVGLLNGRVRKKPG
jgi:hypothetical protein